jgi:hypothetical protein
MTMQIALESIDTSDWVDRRKADAVAQRVARSARTKATATWNPTCVVSREMYADIAFKLTYEVAFVKSIVKQKAKRYGYRIP